jgi:hypothetical protein
VHALHIGQAVRHLFPSDLLGGIGCVVFGLTERRLKTMTGNHDGNPTMDLPRRTVFTAGQRPVEVIVPLLEHEAAALHGGVW